MKNFLIIVLGLGLAASAFLTRPDREDFERYVRKQHAAEKAGGNPLKMIGMEFDVHKDLDNIEVKDFYLWTLIKRDGKTLYNRRVRSLDRQHEAEVVHCRHNGTSGGAIETSRPLKWAGRRASSRSVRSTYQGCQITPLKTTAQIVP